MSDYYLPQVISSNGCFSTLHLNFSDFNQVLSQIKKRIFKWKSVWIKMKNWKTEEDLGNLISKICLVTVSIFYYILHFYFFFRANVCTRTFSQQQQYTVLVRYSVPPYSRYCCRRILSWCTRRCTRTRSEYSLFEFFFCSFFCLTLCIVILLNCLF